MRKFGVCGEGPIKNGDGLKWKRRRLLTAAVCGYLLVGVDERGSGTVYEVGELREEDEKIMTRASYLGSRGGASSSSIIEASTGLGRNPCCGGPEYIGPNIVINRKKANKTCFCLCSINRSYGPP